jgi:hypothetical protein
MGMGGPGAEAWGGGIYCNSNSNATIEDCRITGNYANGGNGGYSEQAGCSGGNGADAYGGGIYTDSYIIIDLCTIADNHVQAGDYGGYCEFSSGGPDGYGGGLYALGQITNSVITGNSASGGWGGFEYGDCYGGGICLYGASSYIFNSTIADNTEEGIRSNSSTAITDCIVYGNGDDLLGCFATYSCIEDGDAGVGNISANPLFVTGPDGDYYLSQIVAGQASDSPCVNAGSDTAVNLGMNVYTTRTDGLNDMGTVDMGYHYPVVFGSPDIDENYNVDFGDFAVQANQWQQSGENLLGDITRDGFVGFDDLDILTDCWLDCYVTTANALSPGNNAAGIDPNADLSWSAGNGAISHDVYFGTDFNDVNNANTSSAEFMVTDANTTFDPGPLDANSTYCWRIDEVGPKCTFKGDVWQFTTIATTEPNFIAWWKFDEGSGSTAYDSTGGNNGALYGPPDWVTGKTGSYALDFDGSNDYVQVADQPIFDTGDKLTVAHWFKTTTNQSQKGMVTHDSSDYKYMTYLSANSGGIAFYIRQSSGVVSALTGDLGTGFWADGQWHLVVGVFDRSLPNNRLKLYVDGQLADVRDVPDENILPGDEGIIIGKWYTGHEFNGSIDDVRIYDRALSDTEVEQLYQAGQ